MKTVYLGEDVQTFYTTPRSFPRSIGEAFETLYRLLPHPGKTFYGISFPDNEGIIRYKAVVAAPVQAEVKPPKSGTFIIRKGPYLAETLMHWRNNEAIIDATFKKLLADPRLASSTCCVEWYKSDVEVMCMVGLKEPL